MVIKALSLLDFNYARIVDNENVRDNSGRPLSCKSQNCLPRSDTLSERVKREGRRLAGRMHADQVHRGLLTFSPSPAVV